MSDRGQVITSAAQVYEEFFVPALFQEWSPRVAQKAGIQTGDSVLDVACGTGIVARTVAQLVGERGSVIGLDVNEGMLSVARQKAPHINWQHGVAEDLPFEDNHFDAVVCQFALMFFENRTKAIQEMMRVLRPNKKLVLAVWGSLYDTPGYNAMVNLLLRLFAEPAANALRAPFNLGDTDTLRALFRDAGIDNIQIDTINGTVQFPSLESWVYTDIKGWTLADMIDNTQYEQLQSEAKTALSQFVMDDGSVRFTSPAHLITVTKS